MGTVLLCCFLWLITVSCNGKETIVTDPRLDTVLQGATYIEGISKAYGYRIWSKYGGYKQAQRDFATLPFNSPATEWADGTKAGYVGFTYIMLSHGVYPGSGSFSGTHMPGHAWIGGKAMHNMDKFVFIVWYLPTRTVEDYRVSEGEAWIKQ